jgi:hypothetical protein
MDKIYLLTDMRPIIHPIWVIDEYAMIDRI